MTKKWIMSANIAYKEARFKDFFKYRNHITTVLFLKLYKKNLKNCSNKKYMKTYACFINEKNSFYLDLINWNFYNRKRI